MACRPLGGYPFTSYFTPFSSFLDKKNKNFLFWRTFYSSDYVAPSLSEATYNAAGVRADSTYFDKERKFFCPSVVYNFINKGQRRREFMNGLIKKMCILKELKKGFSADGAPLGGVVRVEKYGKPVALQISLINFAPLSEGQYVCVLCDKSGERLIFALTPRVGEYRAENTEFDPEKGFCALVCFVKNDVVCLAAGQNGGGSYSLKLLLDGLKPPEKTVEKKVSAPSKTETKVEKEAPMPAIKPKKENAREKRYDDEAVSEENYYARRKGERTAGIGLEDENAVAESDKTTADGARAEKDENDTIEELFHPFAFTDGQSYYLKVKDELEALFSKGERTRELESALPNSEWVKVTDGCAVGIVYEELQARYIAYALPARSATPPKGMENACYIPVKEGGYFVLFQDAATGECVRVGIN